jgi:hypothetical protein
MKEESTVQLIAVAIWMVVCLYLTTICLFAM